MRKISIIIGIFFILSSFAHATTYLNEKFNTNPFPPDGLWMVLSGGYTWVDSNYLMGTSATSRVESVLDLNVTTDSWNYTVMLNTTRQYEVYLGLGTSGGGYPKGYGFIVGGSTNYYMVMYDGAENFFCSPCGSDGPDGILANITLIYNRTVGNLSLYVNGIHKHSEVDITYQTSSFNYSYFRQNSASGAGIYSAFVVTLGGYLDLLNFIPPTPEDGAGNSNQVNINVSCQTGNVNLWFDNSPIPNNQVLTNAISPANWTTNVTAEGTYYYVANCGSENSSTRTWRYDLTEPTITINSKNFFLADNSTQIQRNNQNKNLNFTLTDNIALYGFEVNITDKNGVQKYYLLNETLTGTTAQVVKAIDFTSWDLGNYTVKILASDAHTANKINPYSYKQIANGLEYTTAEGNKISLYSEGQSIAQTTKQTDRYIFDFNFNEKGTKARSIYLTSTNKIRYIKDSPYNGHFVVWNSKTKKGNWIDFEGASKPTILKISDYQYKVTFSSLDDSVSFNSLGGLNVNEIDYMFELISLYPYNVSIRIDNKIQWNHSGEYLGSEYVSLNTTQINNILKNSCSCSGCYISGYNCMVPVVFTSDTIGKLNVRIKNASYSYGLDNCSDTFKIPSNTTFNITTRSQVTSALLITNTSFNIDYWFDPSIVYSYNPVLNDKSSYKFCQYPAWANLSANMANNIQASGYYTLSHYVYDSRLTSVYNAYLAPTGGTHELITFLLINSAGAGVEGATMKIYKTVGGSPTLIYERQSDFSGRVTAYLDQTYPYDFTINASGFPFKEFTLQPTSTSYTITLTSTSTSFYNNEYGDVRFRIWHNDQIGAPININISQQYQNISFEVEGTGLEAIGMALTEHDFICIPASCNTELATTTGGKVTISIKANETGLISTAYYFRRAGGTNTYVNDGVIKVVSFLAEATDSLMQMIEEFKANTSPNTRTIVSAFASVVAVGVGAGLGLFGYLLIIPAVLVNIGLGITGLINPIVALIMTITGTIVFIFVSMKVQ